MKKLLLSCISSFILINSQLVFASETKYPENYNSTTNFQKKLEYQIEKEPLIKVAAVIDLGDKDNESNIKSPLLAMGLSFFIPGAGQVYNGDILKGILLLVGVVGLGLLDFLVVEPHAKANETAKKNDSLFDIGALANRLAFPLLWVYNWGSAYQAADPVYQKKLIEDEKKKNSTPQENTNASLYKLNLFSYKF